MTTHLNAPAAKDGMHPDSHMSLHATSYEELVPSRYALKIGEIDVLVVSDALFPVAFDHPDWHNGFEHDPEESVRVRVRLMRDAAASGELLVATHLPFPSVGRVAVDGDAFRWVAAYWDY
ncbi:hypothetical protein SAMN03159290_00692 [Pseudomonas sp. NFACC13-1]|nr:hypothetical protein SAMN03159290_00692 [Pseudomonas sp. NFACC13-1]